MADTKTATTALVTTCLCDGTTLNCPICQGSDRLIFMPIQSTSNKILSTEELPNNRCRCGSNVRLVFTENQLWKVLCAKGHESASVNLPSDALAQWSLKNKRK